MGPRRRSSSRRTRPTSTRVDRVYVKAITLVAGPGDGSINPNQDFTTFPEVVHCADEAYAQAGINDPRAEFCMAEVHDCFTPTELVLMEDLGFSERGEAWEDVLAGRFDLDGELPVNTDGGLKSFRASDRGVRPSYGLRGVAPAPR